MPASPAQLKKMIGEILEEADLSTISAKKVRQELEKKLDTDLTDKKKEIDKMVLAILEEKQNGSGEKRKAISDSDSEEDESPKKKVKDDSDEDEDSEEEVKSKSKGKKKKAAPAAKAGGKKPGTGYTKLCKLSPELSAVMGEENMARHEVVKKMWALIKEKNLSDPKNKQFAICDAALLPVFGVKRFRTFGMMKYLKNHFLD